MVEAQKHDQGKPRYSLLPWDALGHVVAVLEFGARKYAPGAWRHVPNGKERYWDATVRHLVAYQMGERTDPESGLPTLAHAACSLLFTLALSEEPTE